MEHIWKHWQNAFGGERTVIGRTITLNKVLSTIVGVADVKFSNLFLARRRTSDFRSQGSGLNLMIQLCNIEKSYPAGPGKFWVLRRIDLKIKEGEFVTIMRPSGAGKSTLLSILDMLDGKFAGEFLFLDRAVHKMNPRQRAELNKKYIGFVFQQYRLRLPRTWTFRCPIERSSHPIARRWLPTRLTDFRSWVKRISFRASFPEGSSNSWRWRAR